jgi:hypothetical protein
MSNFRVQFAGVTENTWSSNNLFFETKGEAAQHALDKLLVWSGADMARVVPADTPSRGEVVSVNDPTIVVNYRS